MFLFELEFYPDPIRVDREEYENQVGRFLAALRQNGQVAPEWLAGWDFPRFRAHAVGPAEDALERRHFCPETWRAFEAVALHSRAIPALRRLGPVLWGEPPCDCRMPRAYVLRTDCLSPGSPVGCGDCSGDVPLYRLPGSGSRLNPGELLSWMWSYEACERLWMDSSVGEVFAYRQLSHLHSELTIQGRKLCAWMSVQVGRPFYYFLYRYYRPEEPLCPGCGGTWEIEGSGGAFDYRCGGCRLVSIRPSGSGALRRPRRERQRARVRRGEE